MKSTSGASVAREILALEATLGLQLASEYAAQVAKMSKPTASKPRGYSTARTAPKARAKQQAKRDKLMRELSGAVALIVGSLIALSALAGR